MTLNQEEAGLMLDEHNNIQQNVAAMQARVDTINTVSSDVFWSTGSGVQGQCPWGVRGSNAVYIGHNTIQNFAVLQAEADDTVSSWGGINE